MHIKISHFNPPLEENSLVGPLHTIHLPPYPCNQRSQTCSSVHFAIPVSIGNDDQHFAISSSRLPATWAIHPKINSKNYHQHTTANQIQMYTSLCWSASCMRNIPSRNILFFYSQGYHLFMSSKDTFQTSIMGWSTCIQDWNLSFLFSLVYMFTVLLGKDHCLPESTQDVTGMDTSSCYISLNMYPGQLLFNQDLISQKAKTGASELLETIQASPC